MIRPRLRSPSLTANPMSSGRAQRVRRLARRSRLRRIRRLQLPMLRHLASRAVLLLRLRSAARLLSRVQSQRQPSPIRSSRSRYRRCPTNPKGRTRVLPRWRGGSSLPTLHGFFIDKVALGDSGKEQHGCKYRSQEGTEERCSANDELSEHQWHDSFFGGFKESRFFHLGKFLKGWNATHISHR